MKRSTRHLPDVDLRGRTRRETLDRDHSRKTTAKLFGGPLDGMMMEVPGGTEVIHVGPKPNPLFTYTYAGRDGGYILFAITKRARVLRRFVHWYVGKHGKDPRVEAEFLKAKPVRGRTNKHGRGALKRAIARGDV